MTYEEMDALGIRPRSYGFDTSNILVEWRGAGLWAVTDGRFCLNHDNEWEYEPQPSSRDEAFFERCRFTLHEALTRASGLTKS